MTPRTPPRRRSTLRLALTACLALAACEDDGRFPAQFDTFDFEVTVGAVNGTPLGEPAALALADVRTVRLDQSYNFDLAFDLVEGGRPLVLPPTLVGLSGSGAGRPTAFVRLGSSFDAATLAPRAAARDWIRDSALLLDVGEVIGVRMQPGSCLFDFEPYMYGKVRVDSVDVGRRRLYLRAVINPNCGYRSLAPGRPSN